MPMGFNCCICGKFIAYIDEFGNNPAPVVNDDCSKCCDACNISVVVPTRIKMAQSAKSNGAV